MRSPRRPILAAVCLLAAAACAPRRTPAPGAPAPTPSSPAASSRTITLDSLQRSLGGLKPSTIVFDIDDTALYTGLAFLFAQGYFEERDAGRFRDDRRFWTLINDSLDARFSFHQARGDTVVFVTSRYPSEPASDRTSRLLQRLFALPAPPQVLFTAQAPKTEAIRGVHPAVSYGDSDGDIVDTREADPGIRAIRIIRSPVSYNERPFTPGKYGEEILANSAD
jgi:acid phosphatase (class B)